MPGATTQPSGPPSPQPPATASPPSSPVGTAPPATAQPSVVSPNNPPASGPPPASSSTPESAGQTPVPPPPSGNTGNQTLANGAPATPPTNTPPKPIHASDIKGPRSFRKVLFGLASVVLILGAGLGFVFGYYLPRQPEPMFRAGLERTGIALDRLMTEATSADQLEKLSQLEISGDMEITSLNDAVAFNGEMLFRIDEQSFDGSLSLRGNDSPPMELEMNMLGILDEDEDYPDTYLQVRGIEALGLDFFLPGISQYDGRWIEFSSSFIEEIGEDVVGELEVEPDDQIDQDQVAEFARSVTQNFSDYIFTSGDNAVLELDEYLGEATVDDVDTFHYAVSINVDNAKQFCESLLRDAAATSLVEQLTDDASSSAQDRRLERSIDDCKDGMEDFAEESNLELWMDRSNRVLHKIRFIDADDAGNYIELGQKASAADTLDLFVRISGDEDDISLDMNLMSNVETAHSSFSLDMSFEDTEITFELNMQPLTEAIDVSAPSNSIPVEQVIEDFETMFSAPVMPEPDFPSGIDSDLDSFEFDLETSNPALQTDALPPFASLLESLFE